MRWLVQNASRALGVNIRLHTTVSPAKGYDPLSFDAEIVRNHQTLNEGQFSDLLCKTHFLLGLGDPAMGPTALEMLAHGGLYFNPTYSTPLRFSNKNAAHTADSQHPYLRGKPGVCDIDWGSGAAFEATASKCLELAIQEGAYPATPSAISDFSEDAFCKRVSQIFS